METATGFYAFALAACSGKTVASGQGALLDATRWLRPPIAPKPDEEEDENAGEEGEGAVTEPTP
eukprot:8047574-Pyramimonas_sp.AAC.1